MDKEIDNVAEIVRMFRSMDYVDRQLVKDLLQKIDLSDGLKVKKVSPPQHRRHSTGLDGNVEKIGD